MKVKVEDTVYDSSEQPVMVILENQDKKNIANMLPTATRYCMYPDTWTTEKISAWMKDIGDDIAKEKITREGLYDDLEIPLSELREEYKRGEYLSMNAEPTDGMESVRMHVMWREWKHVEDKLLDILNKQ